MKAQTEKAIKSMEAIVNKYIIADGGEVVSRHDYNELKLAWIIIKGELKKL